MSVGHRLFGRNSQAEAEEQLMERILLGAMHQRGRGSMTPLGFLVFGGLALLVWILLSSSNRSARSAVGCAALSFVLGPVFLIAGMALLFMVAMVAGQG
jgi:hypothetical protein